MPWWAVPFFGIGAIVVVLVLFMVGRELLRAIRQGLRVAYVVNRLDGLRGFKAKVWWRAFRYEMTSSYSYLKMGPFRLDRRLSVRISRAYRRY